MEEGKLMVSRNIVIFLCKTSFGKMSENGMKVSRERI